MCKSKLSLHDQAQLAISLLERLAIMPVKVAAVIRDSQKPASQKLETAWKFIDAMDPLTDYIEQVPDAHWLKDYYLLTGDHMILTEEGWECGGLKSSYEDQYVLDEVNAPPPPPPPGTNELS